MASRENEKTSQDENSKTQTTEQKKEGSGQYERGTQQTEKPIRIVEIK